MKLWMALVRVTAVLAISIPVIGLIHNVSLAQGRLPISHVSCWRVADDVGVLEGDKFAIPSLWQGRLTVRLREVAEQTGVCLTILYVWNTGDERIGSLAQRVLTTAASKANDSERVVSLVVATRDDLAWIATSKGLSDRFNAANVRYIVDEIIVPQLREARYGRAGFDAIEAFDVLLRAESPPNAAALLRAADQDEYWTNGRIAVLLALVLVFATVRNYLALAALINERQRSRDLGIDPEVHPAQFDVDLDSSWRARLDRALVWGIDPNDVHPVLRFIFGVLLFCVGMSWMTIGAGRGVVSAEFRGGGGRYGGGGASGRW